ncbi:hypothetical protein SAMN04488688_104514 [Paenibacillus sp. cl141a]|nr:hypothetical protein SAMN04488688_104514 [Paenibacillus sp. cl141a]
MGRYGETMEMIPDHFGRSDLAAERLALWTALMEMI